MRRPEFGAGLRRFLLVSVLCFLAFSSSAEVVLTDEEYSELLTQLDSLDKIQQEMQQMYSERLQELSEREKELKLREEDLSERKSDLQERQNSLSVRKQQVEILEASLKEQRQEQNRARISNTIDKVLWCAAGILGGYIYGSTR